MKFGIARVVHRSNSFARHATGSADFHQHEFLTGQQIVDRFRSTGTVAGGILDSLNKTGAEVVPLLYVSARAGGPVQSAALDEIIERLGDTISCHDGKLDGLILELSGAMTTTDARSGDAMIATAVRDALPNIPIVAVLSSQANLTDDLASSCSAIIAPAGIPDSTPADTGRRAGELLRALAQSRTPVSNHLERLPLLIPIAAQRTSEQPLHDIASTIDGFTSQKNILNIALCAGYPWADTEHTAASIVVSGAGDISGVATSLRSELWKRRTEFFVQGSNVEEAVHHAMASKEGPVLIADLGDNPDDGAPGDGTTVLWALLDLGVRDATVGVIADEQAVEACFRAGEDAIVEIPVGGRRDTRHGYPIDIRARVLSLDEGAFRLKGPINAGMDVDAGRIVVLNVEARHEGRVELILSERPIQVTDTALFEHVGIDVTNRAIVSIKSSNDYLPAFEPLASKIFEVITPGITTPDPEFYAYQNLRRPIYPLDPFED